MVQQWIKNSYKESVVSRKKFVERDRKRFQGVRNGRSEQGDRSGSLPSGKMHLFQHIPVYLPAVVEHGDRNIFVD
jgi:hypothetical protein